LRWNKGQVTVSQAMHSRVVALARCWYAAKITEEERKRGEYCGTNSGGADACDSNNLRSSSR